MVVKFGHKPKKKNLAEIKVFRKTAGYTLLDYKKNEDF